MDSPFTGRVISAERLQGSVLIMFNDGKYAVYSAALLYATLEQAEPVDLDPEDCEEIRLIEKTLHYRNVLPAW